MMTITITEMPGGMAVCEIRDGGGRAYGEIAMLLTNATYQMLHQLLLDHQNREKHDQCIFEDQVLRTLAALKAGMPKPEERKQS